MPRSSDRLSLLETFCRIAERGSISGAARDLGISQASASRRLSELETRLGTRLIERTTHRQALTETGESVVVEARTLIEGWDELMERFAGDAQRVEGPLRVVAPVALGQRHLNRVALGFQRAHRDVRLTWLLDDEPVRFAETGCDLWIRVGAPEDERLIVRQLAHVERTLVCAPALVAGRDVAKPADLREMPCAVLGPFEGATIPLTFRSGGRATLPADVAVATNNIFAARDAALDGNGYAVMPLWLVEEDLAAGSLVRPLPDWSPPALPITASFLPSRRQTRRLRVFLEHIEQAFREIPGIALSDNVGA